MTMFFLEQSYLEQVQILRKLLMLFIIVYYPPSLDNTLLKKSYSLNYTIKMVSQTQKSSKSKDSTCMNLLKMYQEMKTDLEMYKNDQEKLKFLTSELERVTSLFTLLEGKGKIIKSEEEKLYQTGYRGYWKWKEKKYVGKITCSSKSYK